MRRNLITASAIVIGAFFALVCVFTAGFFMGRNTTLRAAGYSNRPGFFFGAAPRALGRFGALPGSRVLPSRRFPSRDKSATSLLQKIDGQTLTIQTPKGITETVLADNQTQFMRGRRPRYGSRGLRAATLSDLKPGDRIIAIGRRNTQGQLIARTLIALDPSEQPRPSRRSFPFRRFR